MTTRWLAFLTCLLTFPGLAQADDWPQFGGPDRSGSSQEKGLLQSWPKGGPKLLWTYKDSGLGYSSPAIVGDRLYTLGARGDTAFVICLDVKSGKEIWHSKLGPRFTFKGNRWGDGPRSTPTVDGKLLYALGGYGDLVCLETTGGKEVWRKNLRKDLGGQMMTVWGYSESPLVDGDKVICTPGGPKGTLAALDKKTGKVIWRSKELKDCATYASLRLLKLGDVRQYVGLSFHVDNYEPTEGKGGAVEGAAAVAGVAAADGKLLWHQPFFKGSAYEISPTPQIQGNLVYVTAESTRCQLLQITPESKERFAVKELYNRLARKVMENWHGGVVLAGKYVYGYSNGKGWTCQDLKTGKAAWVDRSSLECGSGSIISGDGRLYLYSDQGVAVLLKPSSQGWDEAGRFELPQKSMAREQPTGRSGGVWTHPALANGRLYLRDQELLFCYDIRAAK
jgi:outer membrane protein assembly factor BamB